MRSVTVYSSEHGRMCPVCGQPIDSCICRRSKSAPKGDGIIRVGKESKGRKGKDVTVVTGLTMTEDELKELLTEIKRKCSSGGTLKDFVLEVQGDHRDLIVALLKTKGFAVKKVGG